MKRVLFPLLTALLFTATLTSCLSSDDSEYTVEPTEPGQVLYNYAETQHAYSLDPARVAFSLGIVLEQAKAEGVTDLTQLKYKVDGVEYRLISYLLGSSTTINLTEASKGTYGLHFSYFDGSYRDGTLYIQTNNLMLSELTPSQSWDIVIDDATEFNYQSLTGSTVLKYTKGRIGISGNAESTGWNILVEDVQLTMSGYSSNGSTPWEGSYELTKTDDRQLTTESVHNSTFDLTGTGAGMIYAGAKMYYDIAEPMHYVPKCASAMLYSTVVEAGFAADQQVDSSYYPATKATLEVIGSGDCKRTVYINYNGERAELK